MRKSLLTMMLCAAVPAATLVVPAASAQPTVDKKKTAKEYVDAGLAAQNAGDYETALTFFGKAYELVPHPVLLFNMAQAHRLAGRATVAIDFYKRYLEAEPKGPQARTARELSIALEVQLASETAKKFEEARLAEEARKAEEARYLEEARLAQERKAEEARLAEEARKGEESRVGKVGSGPVGGDTGPSDGGGQGKKPGGAMRIAGLATAGVGVGAVGVGLFVFGAKASKLSDELSQPGAVYDPQKISDGEAANRTMIIATAAGGVLIGGGIVLYMMGRKKGAAGAERTSLVPTIVPTFGRDGVGLAFTGVLP